MELKEVLKRNFIFSELKSSLNWKNNKPVSRFPHGHFYSPIVSKNELQEFHNQIWEEEKNTSIEGIDLNTDKQLALLSEFSKYYSELPFEENKSEKYRYYFNNKAYNYTDGIMLYSFMRHFQPKRIIEIGSGFSSAMMLDTKDLFLNDTSLTFIEPYPALLYSLFKEKDKQQCKVFDTKVQNVDIEEFKKLEANDILFIDSSHVSKTGSDVNYELFKILPNLKSGVIIHIHDIFYPFEYPEEWVYGGRNWNENYLVRAFLSYNDKFEILHFATFIHKHHKAAFENMPLTYKNKGGNLWIRKK